MHIFFYIILFLFGLSLGSFFNVLLLRYKEEKGLFNLKNISGRSHCPHCLTNLKFKELIPLFSFFYQKGKCVYCRAKISYIYPLVEFLTGAIIVLTPYFINKFYKVNEIYFWMGKENFWYYILVLVWLFVLLTLWLIVLFDFKYYLIPNELNFILLLLGLIYSFVIYYHLPNAFPFKNSFLENYSLVFSFTSNIMLNHIGGAFLGGMFFLLLVLLTRGKGIGVGDVKLAFALGMVLGWPDIALTIIISFILGGFIALFTMILRKKGWKDKVPFAPIFVLGTLVTMFFGKELLTLYFSIFNV